MNDIAVLENLIAQSVVAGIQVLYGQTADMTQIQIQKTKKEFEGDLTLVVFPLLRLSKKSPDVTASELGEYLSSNMQQISEFNVIKGFLNLTIDSRFWIDLLFAASGNDAYGFTPDTPGNRPVVVEYSSPNTNKPLHLGHIRNNLLGFSVAEILKANGHRVVKVNLVNDRGIHICKSMLAWQKFGHGATPASTGKKGDHLVGEYYVKFDQEYKRQIAELTGKGIEKAQAEKQAPILLEAQEMLRKWEAGDPEIVGLWKEMNSWVYAGFDETYKKLGVDFDKTYYESETYLLGKAIVMQGVENGVLYQRPDNSIWIDLTADGLDEKLLLRSDGTSVYMTQDIGTACQRMEEYNFTEHIYVVGNEQDYHFRVLSLALQKLGHEWAKNLYHLSYGMVELPEGKMKSREGTVVDADDLIAEMVETARQTSLELGKLDNCSEEEARANWQMIALGALKYFILKVDPKKNMTFNPRESIDFNGNTGPFIQYTHARIRSVLRKAAEQKLSPDNRADRPLNIVPKERTLIQLIGQFPQLVCEAGATHSPALVANYVYDLAKEYNQYYHDHSILNEPDATYKNFRLVLSQATATVIRQAMTLLGIQVPEVM